MVHIDKTDSKKSLDYAYFPFLLCFIPSLYSHVWSDCDVMNKKELFCDNIISNSVFNVLGLCLFEFNFFYVKLF